MKMKISKSHRSSENLINHFHLHFLFISQSNNVFGVLIIWNLFLMILSSF